MMSDSTWIGSFRSSAYLTARPMSRVSSMRGAEKPGGGPGLYAAERSPAIAYSLPPAQPQGMATAMSSRGYHLGPNSGPRPQVARASTLLQLFEHRVEPLEIAFPEPAIALQPPGRLREPPRFQPSRPSLGVASARDQSGPLQHFEVLGDGRLAHVEGSGQLGDRRLTRCQAGEDRPPRRVCQ